MRNKFLFFSACFCMGTGVLLPVGIALMVAYYWDDVKRFLKPELYPEPIKKEVPKGKAAIFHDETLEANK